MRAKIVWKIAVLLSIIAFTLVLSAWESYLRKPPLSEAISLNPPGTVESEIKIPLPERYELQLQFARAGHSFDELHQLIGDFNPPPGGIPVTVDWSLSAIPSGMIVDHGSAYSSGSDGWSNDYVSRSVVAAIRVKPGRYKLRVAVSEAVPQLAKLSPRVILRFEPKGATSWQMGAVLWGSIITVFVFYPLFAFVLLWLAWNLIRHLTRR
jgi:hypothetical protein